MTGLRLPNSPPHTPTLRSRLPWAIAGARPVPRTRPAPSAPAVKPRRVTPWPFASLDPLLIAVSCLRGALETPVVFLQSVFHDLMQQRDQARRPPGRRAVDVGNETGIGSIHRPTCDACVHDAQLRCLVVQHLAVPQVTGQRRRNAVSSPIRDSGEHQDVAFSNRANAAMAGAAAVLAERLDLAHRFLDHTAADLVAAVADADRGNALGLGTVGKMAGAGDLVGRARRSHDLGIDALDVAPDLLDDDHRRRLELLAERGGGLLAGGVPQRDF